MTGTHPDFYLIPLTIAPSNALNTGQRPATQTEVLHCPTEATLTWHASVGMESTEYIKVALKRFLAFKELAKSHWAPIGFPQPFRERLARSNFSWKYKISSDIFTTQRRSSSTASANGVVGSQGG